MTRTIGKYVFLSALLAVGWVGPVRSQSQVQAFVTTATGKPLNPDRVWICDIDDPSTTGIADKVANGEFKYQFPKNHKVISFKIVCSVEGLSTETFPLSPRGDNTVHIIYAPKTQANKLSTSELFRRAELYDDLALRFIKGDKDVQESMRDLFSEKNMNKTKLHLGAIKDELELRIGPEKKGKGPKWDHNFDSFDSKLKSPDFKAKLNP